MVGFKPAARILALPSSRKDRIEASSTGWLAWPSGFQVFDMGVDVPAAKIVSKAKEENADIVALSALLTTTMVKQQEVIQALEKAGLHGKVKVMVGGAPVTRDWVQKISADGYSEDAIGAVASAQKLIKA